MHTQSILSLDDVMPAPQHIHLAEIIKAVCAEYRITLAEFKSHRRFKTYCEARHVYCWVAHKFTTCSYPLIGRHCGDRDHTTVMHGSKKVDLHFHEFSDKIAKVLEALGIEYEVAA